MEALSHLPRDNAAVMIKQGYSSILGVYIDKLYSIAPSLNDESTIFEHDPEDQSRPRPDAGDHVVRFVFREFIAWRGDTETLADATETDSIASFLKTRGITELECYVKFFEHFANGRPDTWHFLRNAVSDYLLPSTASSINILGGRVATDDNERRISLEGWDIIYQYFSDIVSWYNVEAFCTGFEECLLVKRLVTLNRYGRGKVDERGWLNEEDDVCQECQIGTFLGFIANNMGYCDPPVGIETADGVTTETQFRNYAAGRMARADTRAKALIEELASRVAELIVIVYDGPANILGDNTVFKTEDDPWLKRKRSARSGQRLEDAEWEVEMAFDIILSDLYRQRLMRKEVMTDYFQFIIIDREPRRINSVLAVVEDALMQLAGDPPHQQTISEFIRQFIPASEHEPYLKITSTIENGLLAHSTASNLHYEGSRVRAWDIDHDFVQKHLEDRISSSQSPRRLMSAILSDIESHGLITLQKNHETPQARPVLIQGSDGNDDIYFHYIRKALNEDEERRLIELGFRKTQPKNCLYDFALSYAARHDNAIFAKGKIQVHYCAWPLPPPCPLNFRTLEGHIYRWNAMPFDFPYSAAFWQSVLDIYMNKQFPFALFMHTTFVVCATSVADAETKLRQIISEAEKHKWKLSVPAPVLWSSDIESLDLETPWSGIYPSRYKGQRKEEDLTAEKGCIIQ